MRGKWLQQQPLTSTRLPVIALMAPGLKAHVFLLLFASSLVVWSATIWWAGMPVWAGTTLVLALLAGPSALKWRADWHRYGAAVAVLGVLLLLQSFHMVEHVTQVIQFYVLRLSPFRSSGLISSLNVEWVHFIWNWLVVGGVLYLVQGGMRSWWTWALVAWSLAHSIEHTYLFVRYLQLQRELWEIGLPPPAVAQALPGILGRDGLLAKEFYCRVPGITTAPRVAIHFWWNMGEITLLLLAANTFLRERFYATKIP